MTFRYRNITDYERGHAKGKWHIEGRDPHPEIRYAISDPESHAMGILDGMKWAEHRARLAAEIEDYNRVPTVVVGAEYLEGNNG